MRLISMSIKLSNRLGVTWAQGDSELQQTDPRKQPLANQPCSWRQVNALVGGIFKLSITMD
jgi:hypothetical protein